MVNKMTNKLNYELWELKPANSYIPAERQFDNIVYRDPLTAAVEYRTSFKHFTDTKRVSIWIYDLNGNIVKKDYLPDNMYSIDIKLFAYKMMEKYSQENIIAPIPIAPKTPVLSKRLYTLYMNKITAKHHTIRNNVYITESMRSRLIDEFNDIVDMVKAKYGVDLL
jgi:hypothetical protein